MYAVTFELVCGKTKSRLNPGKNKAMESLEGGLGELVRIILEIQKSPGSIRV